ncbi:Uu.00g083250.m01.CDS01 [Anthostomella pinea]|uniref:Uu.00g083250.m01.CDS01 n=1 Tax=Anthostomella pinea TaxID=933095 RepID=A0AAI8YH68_9PEZI|nr:Uu.00g083250.m01.CDS01 [Anthostomella pinea]
MEHFFNASMRIANAAQENSSCEVLFTPETCCTVTNIIICKEYSLAGEEFDALPQALQDRIESNCTLQACNDVAKGAYNNRIEADEARDDEIAWIVSGVFLTLFSLPGIVVGAFYLAKWYSRRRQRRFQTRQEQDRRNANARDQRAKVIMWREGLELEVPPPSYSFYPPV